MGNRSALLTSRRDSGTFFVVSHSNSETTEAATEDSSPRKNTRKLRLNMRSMQFVRVPVILIAAAASAGCGASKSSTGPNLAASSQSCKGSSNLVPVSAPEGSTIALGRIGANKSSIAFVADEDARSIIAVDLETNKEIARTRLSSAPAQVVIGKDGRMFATLRDNSKVAVLESEGTDGTLALRCEVDVASDPQGIALTPDQNTLLVTSGYGRTASGFDTKSMKTKFAIEVPREPRGVVVTEDGKTAFISHAVGSQMSVLELGDTPQVKKVSLRAKNVSPFSSGMTKIKRRVPKDLGPVGKNPSSGFDRNSFELHRARGVAIQGSTSFLGRDATPVVTWSMGWFGPEA